MPARTLDGRALAGRRNDDTARRIQDHLADAGRPPRLDVILVGSDEASKIYVRNKAKKGKKVGVETHIHEVAADIDQAGLERTLREVEENDTTDGVVLQLPLPDHLDARPLLASIDPDKDVDGFHPLNMGRLLSGTPGAFVPATPLGILWFLEDEKVPLTGAEVVVVSHSNLIGKPLAALLINHDATVTVTHVHTRDLAAHTRRADILVTAAGVPGLITADHVRDGAFVVDAATVLDEDGHLVGDCAAEVGETAGAQTPVPGGVGPVTVSALLSNTVDAWMRRTG